MEVHNKSLQKKVYYSQAHYPKLGKLNLIITENSSWKHRYADFRV